MRQPHKVLLACALLLGAGTACGGSDDAAPVPAVNVTETRTEQAQPSGTQAPITQPPITQAPSTDVPVTQAPVVATSSPTAYAPAAASYTMPKLIGRNLQDAQDALQVVVGSFYFSTSSDASGQGRAQVLDNGWKVCSQSIAAGSKFTQEQAVDFAVVRLSESC